MSRQNTLVRALNKLAPGSEWVLRGDQYSDLEWLDQVQLKPDEATLMATAEELEDIPEVPSKTSKLGIKRALEEMDMWDDVKAAIAANPSIQEEWELAVEVSRNDPLTQSMIATLGMTPEQIDLLILRANELTS